MPGLVVAEDISMIRSHIVRIVTQEKPEIQPIVEARNGQEALSLVNQTRPDIVLMDIKMPELDGLEATRRIHIRYPDIKTIILTAHDEFVYAQQALRLGAVDYILKPIRPNQLVVALSQVQNQIRLEQQQKENFFEMAHRQHFLSGEDRPAEEENFQGHQSLSHQIETPVQQAIEYIHNNLSHPELSLNMVANTVNLSTSHLAFLLKATLGVSYIQYVTYLRLEQAKILLKTTTLNIATVAEMIGYTNPAYFYRLFQRETNMTPTVYRHADPTHRSNIDDPLQKGL
ncbi:MAG TPA: response regulator [Anaerolineae bacterium]|nr:response regulator [Anaerolineae bacterium]HRV94404.1 response regulator [Anaerolineae bacterium]